MADPRSRRSRSSRTGNGNNGGVIIDIKALRQHYAPDQPHPVSGYIWTPYGSADVLALCDYVDGLLQLVRDLQGHVPLGIYENSDRQLERLREKKR